MDPGLRRDGLLGPTESLVGTRTAAAAYSNIDFSRLTSPSRLAQARLVERGAQPAKLDLLLLAHMRRDQ
jgi:hypothetical protein